MQEQTTVRSDLKGLLFRKMGETIDEYVRMRTLFGDFASPVCRLHERVSAYRELLSESGLYEEYEQSRYGDPFHDDGTPDWKV